MTATMRWNPLLTILLCTVLGFSTAAQARPAPADYHPSRLGVGILTRLSSADDYWRPYEELQTDSGHRYVMQAVTSGSFGVYSVAIDEEGRRWGIKSVSFQHFGLIDLRRELGLLGTVSPEMEIRELIRTGDQVHVVMTPMAGDVLALAPQLGWYTPLLRAMLAQVSADAHKLHTLGFVHNDIRLPNMLWHPDGRIMLADYGLAARLDDEGQVPTASAAVYAWRHIGQPNCPFISAPEMFLGSYGTKADVWALGLATAQMMTLSEPLSTAVFSLSQSPVPYEAWRDSLRDAEGKIRVDNIPMSHLFAQNVTWAPFNAIFSAIRAVDRDLCQLLVEHVLVTNPAERYGMQQLHDAVVRLQKPDDAQSVQWVLTETHDHDQNDQREAGLQDGWQGLANGKMSN